MQNNKTPEIRFKGFTNDWEQRKLGETCKLNGRIGFRGYTERDIVTKEAGGVLTFSPTNIVNNKLTMECKNTYITREKYDESPEIKISNGDILFVKTGSTLGKSALVTGLKEDASINPQIVVMRVEKDSETFMSNVLITHGIMKQVAAVKIGGAVPTMTETELKNLTYFAPVEKEEQKKIGDYFTNLDHLITLHQRKHDKLISFKKAMLEKMFPKENEKVPEIRFQGFTDDWEQRKWIDVVDISTEMVNPTTGEYDNMPHIAPGNIESFTGRILDNVKTVKEEQLISGKYRFRPDDVVYGKINPQLGKYFYATVNGLTSADAYVFNGKNGLKQKFLFALLQTSDFFKYSVSVSKRSGMPKINRDELNAYCFLMPSEEEQDKIGTYLLLLDDLITLHQRKHSIVNFYYFRRRK